MSILAGALAGAGGAMQDIGAQFMKSDLDREARREDRQMDSDLTMQRAKALEQFKMDMQQAPMKRLSESASKYAAEEVPREARAVTSVGGAVPLAEGEMGPKGPGFEGDVGIIQRAISKMPEGADKQAALAQLRRQMASESNFEESIVAGQTRKRTPDEALGAAVEDAKTNDLPAYSAYESTIGKSVREERRVANDEKRIAGAERVALAKEQTALEREERRDARLAETEDRRDARQQARIDAAERRKEKGGDISREERLRYTSLFSDAGRRLSEAQRALTTLQKDAASKLAEPGSARALELEDLKASIRGYQDERRLYQGLLGGSQTSGSADAPTASRTVPSLPAGAKQIGTSGGKPVYQTPDGKRYIGK